MTSKHVLDDLRSILDEKSYRVGTVRKWASGEFQKTKQGWVPVAAGKAGAEPAAPAPIPTGKAGKKAPAKMSGGVGAMVKAAQKTVAAWFPDKDKEKGPADAPGGQPPAEPSAEPPADKAPKEKPAAKEKPAPKSGYYEPNPTSDKDGDGVADAARVGVPAFDVPPPPGIPRLPNLNEKERELESKFADAVEQDPEEAVNSFYEAAKKSNFVFETDAAKNLMPEWTRPDLPPDEKNAPVHPERAAVRALYNTALHQTANAVAKKAFLKRLDEIEKMDKNDPKRRVLVTSGGCAAGKGLSLAADPSLAANASATWDAAGEQNATENPWVLEECEKRGIPATFLFVHNDPKRTIKDAVSRAARIGRMVDTKVFADSYALGAKNFDAFHRKNKGKADFVIARAGKPPTNVDSVPEDALSLKSEEIDQFAQEHLDSQRGQIPDYVIDGATAGNRIWGKKGKAAESVAVVRFEAKPPEEGEIDHRMAPSAKKKLADQFLKALEKGLSAPDKYYGDQDRRRTEAGKPLKGLEGELIELPPDVQQMVKAELEKRTKGAKGKGSKGKDVLADLERVLSDIKDMIGKSKK